MNIFKKLKRLPALEKELEDIKQRLAYTETTLKNLRKHFNELFDERTAFARKTVKQAEELVALRNKYEKVCKENRHLENVIEKLKNNI